MAARSSRMPAVAGHLQVCFFCVVLIFGTTLSGADGKSLLYNKTGRYLVLTGDGVSTAVPPERSIELEGARQQKKVTIQVVKSEEVAGPLDLPDQRALEVVWMNPSSDTRYAGELVAVRISASANLGMVDLGAYANAGP